MMRNSTRLKFEALKKELNGKTELDRFNYDVLYKAHKKAFPCWATLKNNELIKKDRTEIWYEDGYEEEFIAVNIYKVTL